jgi:peptide deformylase
MDVSKLKITRYPAPVLAEETKPVTEFNDDLRRLADKMLDIMVETKGVGLAGPQAGVPLRIFVISVDGTKANGKAYINPVIEPYGNIEINEEGCLSLPGIWSKIRRFSNCRVNAFDLDGKEFSEDVTGLHARALQHENDHLEGKLIVDRMSQVSKIAARNRLKELREIYEESLAKQEKK